MTAPIPVTPAGASVTALSYLIEDRSLVIGSSMRQAQEGSTTRFQILSSLRIHFRHRDLSLASHKKFITGDTQGDLFVHYSQQAIANLCDSQPPSRDDTRNRRFDLNLSRTLLFTLREL